MREIRIKWYSAQLCKAASLLQRVASYDLHVVPVFVVHDDMKESNPVCYLSVHHTAFRDNMHKNFSSSVKRISINALVSFCHSWISTVNSSRNAYPVVTEFDADELYLNLLIGSSFTLGEDLNDFSTTFLWWLPKCLSEWGGYILKQHEILKKTYKSRTFSLASVTILEMVKQKGEKA